MDVVSFLGNIIISPYFLISISFWLICLILTKLLGKKKENITLFFPFLALFRIKRFNRFFQRIAKKNAKAWRVYWNIGIIASFLLMAYAIYFFISNFFQLILDPKPENAIMPLIPGVTIEISFFSYLILPLLLTVSIHELSHAIAAEADGVNVKSSGVMTAGIIFIVAFGAFVEVDQFQLYSKTISSKTRLRVASAGIWSNIILAGLMFLLMFNFTNLARIGYLTEGFRIEGVVSTADGGYNEGNIEPGDIVYKINDTIVDVSNGAALEDFVSNRTALKCSAGDKLNLTCYNQQGDQYHREVVLGHRYFVGFEFQKYNNSAFIISSVYPELNGGNNDKLNLTGKIITHFNNTAVNYDTGVTFNQFLTQNRPEYEVNLTTSQQKTILIRVSYFSDVPGAYVLDNIYLGIFVTKIDDSSIRVDEVFRNLTESGINEGHIPEGAVITHINGIPINLSDISFREFMQANFDPNPGDHFTFRANDGQEYLVISTKIPIIPLYIGITSVNYWIPRNWVGSLFGGIFPNELYRFIYFTFIISFSLALFNLIPTTIFDGGRMVKEVIELIIGNKKYDIAARKRLKYEFDPTNAQMHLMTQGVRQIIDAKMIIDDNQSEIKNLTEDSLEEEMGKLEFISLDTSTDGFIDTIEIKNPEKIRKDSIIEVEIEYEQDLDEKKKKTIYNAISWIFGGVLVASILISVIKFNNALFWL